MTLLEVNDTKAVPFSCECGCGRTGAGGPGYTFTEVIVELPSGNRLVFANFWAGSKPRAELLPGQLFGPN